MVSSLIGCVEDCEELATGSTYCSTVRGHFFFRGGMSPFLPAPFGIPTLARLLRLAVYFFLRCFSRNKPNSEQKCAATKEWLHMRNAAQFGQLPSHHTTPCGLQVTMYGLLLDLLATITVLSELPEKQGPLTTAPLFLKSSLAFFQIPSTVVIGIPDKLAS